MWNNWFQPIAGNNNNNNSNNANDSKSPGQNDNVGRRVANAKEMKTALLGSLQTGWGSVVEATKHARVVVEKEQSKIQQQAEQFYEQRILNANKKYPYKRDLSLDLDVDALRDAEVVYVTNRLVVMGHPSLQSNVDGEITAERKLAAVGHLLERRHGGRYMVWNLSELEYNTSVLEDQVMTYKFPGSPAPPLGLWLKILLSMESWLKADSRNVAILHCLTGRGRSSVVMAAFLCWMAEAGFSHDTDHALQYIAQCKHLSTETLTIPSQRRYLTYFANMLDGVRPSQPPLILKRIILSEAPKFGKRPFISEDDDYDGEEMQHLGCAPYLQVFKAGSLVFTTTAAKTSGKSDADDLPFCTSQDGAISFNVETPVQGDILIRCRHLSKKGQRISMFRVAFHTGYVPPKVMRLTKSQIDGACSDKRFASDFFLDFIFEPCDASEASKHLLSSSVVEDHEKGEVVGKEEQQHMDKMIQKHEENKDQGNEATVRRNKGTILGAGHNGVTITASAYDSMLHRDSRFWDVIAQRRQSKQQNNSTDKNENNDDDNIDEHETSENPIFGATIGKRRDFSSNRKSKESKGDHQIGSSKNSNNKNNSMSGSNLLQQLAFSIGGDFEFMEQENEETTKLAKKKTTPKKDDLMDALMAIDDMDDEDDHHLKGISSVDVDSQKPSSKKSAVEEEIVFDHEDDEFDELQEPPSESKDEKDDKVILSSETTESKKKVEVEEKINIDGACSINTSPSKDGSGNTGSTSYDFVEDSTLGEIVQTANEDIDDVLANHGLDENDEINLDDLDDDDDELEDLEKFLTQKKY